MEDIERPAARGRGRSACSGPAVRARGGAASGLPPAIAGRRRAEHQTVLTPSVSPGRSSAPLGLGGVRSIAATGSAAGRGLGSVRNSYGASNITLHRTGARIRSPRPVSVIVRRLFKHTLARDAKRRNGQANSRMMAWCSLSGIRRKLLGTWRNTACPSMRPRPCSAIPWQARFSTQSIQARSRALSR